MENSQSKINITNEMMEYLLDFIKPTANAPVKTSISICDSHKKSLRDQLVGLKIYPSILPDLKKKLYEIYYSSLIPAGESIGITCAQSIGEKGTQSTLNTFHSCGVSDRVVTTGVPRLQELLNSTKIPKTLSCKVFFKKKPQTVFDARKEVGISIVGLTIKKLSISDGIKINLNKTPESWYSIFMLMYPSNRSEFVSKSCITVTMDIDKLYEYKLTHKNICESIEAEYDDVYVICSPPQFSTIDIFFDMTNINIPVTKLNEYKQGSDHDFYLEEIVKPKIESFIVCGIPEISDIYYMDIKTGDSQEWIAETVGSNLYALMANPVVDATRSISNNCWEIYKTLGIEATRQFLISEFTSIVEGVNECHIKLLVDRMTYTGTISAISRYTMRQDPAGVFSRMSFEESVVNGLESAACGDSDDTKGISASIVCGKKASIGTGMMDLIMDLSKFIDLPIMKSETVVERF
jgi:DNA-directed RNA polymerase beta' subunit